MKILCTGGSGFLGSHVVENLLNRGLEVRVLQHCHSRSAEALLPFYKGKLEIVYGDIRNPDTCLSACKGIDGVIHLAALIHVDESREIPRDYWDVNVGGTFNLLEGARLNDVKRFTYMSTAERFGNVVPRVADEETAVNPSSPYAASKYAAERYAVSYNLTYGLPVSIVIGFNIYGPRQRHGTKGAMVATFTHRALRGEDLTVYGSGEQTRDYTYVKDMAEGVAQAHLSPKTRDKTLILASGREHRVIDIAERIIELTGSSSKIQLVEARPGENLRSCGDPGKARRLLGWRAATPFEVGLRETMEYLRQL